LYVWPSARILAKIDRLGFIGGWLVVKMKEKELWQGFGFESRSEVAVLGTLYCCDVSSTKTAIPGTSGYALP